jgi:glycosyltransferase involved in cell wall biosynthesis
MNILIAHSRYRFPGGEDVVVANEAACLQAGGHTVHTWITDNRELARNKPVRTIATLLWNRRSARTLAHLLASHKPDLVHFHNTFGAMSPSVYRTAARAGIPIIQTLHNYRAVCLNALLLRDDQPCERCLSCAIPWPGVRYRCYRNSYSASLGMALVIGLHRLNRTLQRRVTLFIALTEFARDHYIAAGFPADRIAVKPNFAPDVGVLRETNGRQVLYAGRLAPEKGVRTLLAAADILGHIPFTIAGAGPERARLTHQARHLPNVTFTGALPPPELAQLLAQSRMVVIPSLCYESFGMVAIEAFRAGVPVVASRIGALPCIITHGYNGTLVPPGDVPALAQAIRSLWDQPELNRAYGRHARQTYTTSFSPQPGLSALEETYARALDLHRAARRK